MPRGAPSRRPTVRPTPRLSSQSPQPWVWSEGAHFTGGDSGGWTTAASIMGMQLEPHSPLDSSIRLPRGCPPGRPHDRPGCACLLPPPTAEPQAMRPLGGLAGLDFGARLQLQRPSSAPPFPGEQEWCSPCLVPPPAVCCCRLLPWEPLRCPDQPTPSARALRKVTA